MEFLKITNTHSKDPLFTSMPRFVIQLQKFSSHAKAAGNKTPGGLYTYSLLVYFEIAASVFRTPYKRGAGKAESYSDSVASEEASDEEAEEDAAEEDPAEEAGSLKV